MGKIGQNWLNVFKDLKPLVRKGKQKVDGYVWGARVVKCVLTLVIQKERNDGVHGSLKKSFSLIRQKHIEEEIRSL